MWPRVWPGVGTATMRPSAVRALEVGNAPSAGPSRVIGSGVEARRQRLAGDGALEAAHGGVGDRDLARVGEDGGVRDVREAVDVVAVDVGEDDGLDVGGGDVCGLELVVELVVAA